MWAKACISRGVESMTRIKFGKEACRKLLELEMGNAISSDDYREALRLCSGRKG